MPKTIRHLKGTGWYSLKGYNKIEDNTFPNVMAFLSGKSILQLKTSCWQSQYFHLDECPIIWKRFSEQGYITAYAEDHPHTSTFNCNKMGFLVAPTDYYMRPFLIAAGRYISNGSCLGPAKPANHIFNYSLDFAELFHDQPTFSLFWLNSFSHNDANEPSAMDDEVFSYFQRLVDTGILNTSMVIFLSDHGLRAGPPRETYVGRIEDRLPFIYIWLPAWFKSAYPEKTKNLVENANRLTSPYDLYMTLVDILSENTTAEGCPGCQSLFKPVPWNRSCSGAGITEHWCACNEYEDIPFDFPWARQLAETVVDWVNNVTAFGPCSKLKLKKVLSLKQRTFGTSPVEPYVVSIQTIPGDAKFEATVISGRVERYWPPGIMNWKVLDTVSRINFYNDQSYCVGHYLVKEYCFCRDYYEYKRKTKSMQTEELSFTPNSPSLTIASDRELLTKLGIVV